MHGNVFKSLYLERMCIFPFISLLCATLSDLSQKIRRIYIKICGCNKKRV